MHAPAYLGWEWTQIGNTAENHYGHKNVVLLDTEDDSVPARPIAAMGKVLDKMQKAETGMQKYLLPALDFKNRQAYYDFERFIRDTKVPLCDESKSVRDLPLDCMEYAATPAVLFDKLRQWDFPALVIPHGTGIGHHSPTNVTWAPQLTRGNADPNLQTMYEVYSGHGASEQYKSWRAVRLDANGQPHCPQPTEDYLPMCWRAGQIIRERCEAEGESEEECARREVETRQLAANAGKNAFAVVSGQQVEDWLDAGQCKDCFQPTHEMRPLMNVQAALATRNFETGPGETDRFKFALIGSSDNHSAMPGTGYKEKNRHQFADVSGPESTRLGKLLNREEKTTATPRQISALAFLKNAERSRSFVYTGGLVAVHASGRDRHAVWDALQRKEVYGTSGPRILLWFDLLNGGEENATAPMGAELEMNHTPRFRVRAMGAFKQKPGCPEYAYAGLGADAVDRLCYGECYNPSDERYRITRIEVVKITPQQTADETYDKLIHDTWRTFDCPVDGVGCVVEFEDPDFTGTARDALYYARAIQEPSPSINGGNLRCEYDAKGNCIKVNPCYTDERTGATNDCLMDNEHRAWSSPIFIDFR